MGFEQYFLKWLSLSFSYPWNILQAVLGIATIVGMVITAKKPHWRERVKNITWAWKVPLIIFAVVFVVTFVKSSYDLYQDLYLKYETNVAELSNDLDILTSKVLILQKVESTPYSEQMAIQINKGSISFPNADVVVSNRIFNDCSLFVNQNYLYFKNCIIVDGSAKGMTRFAVIPINAIPEGEVIQFTDCVLQDCWFVDANIIGNEEEIIYCESNINHD